MAQTKNNTREINLKTLFETCVKLWWVIVLLVFLGGLLGGVATIAVTDQTYESTSMLYVNNTSSLSSLKEITSSLSISDLNAAKDIADVYAIIIKTRSTLNEAAKRLNDLKTYYPDITYTPVDFGHKDFGQEGGFSYDYDYLIELLTVSTVDETEVLKITIVSENQAESIVIANTIADVAISQIPSIINGTSVKTVDPAIIATPISRGFGKNILIGALVGLVVAAIIILIIYFVDDVITREQTITEAFGESIPVLATIPDSNDVSKHKYKKYYTNYDYQYGEYYKSSDENAGKPKENK